MILHWEQLAPVYGPEVDRYSDRFAKAKESTSAMLCCRLTESNARIAASGGDHAERKLLDSGLWTFEIPNALEHWVRPDQSPVVVTLLVNRTPCHECAGALVSALRHLQWRFAARFPNARFLLACLGAYEGKPGPQGLYPDQTTMGDLRRLHEVGWSLCVLQVGPKLSPRGEMLHQALNTLGATLGDGAALPRFSATGMPRRV